MAPADPNPPGEISVWMVEVGTLRGSEPEPTAGAVSAVIDVLEGVSVKPIAPALVCVGSVIAGDPVVLDDGPISGTTWACATSRTASHIIITKTRIRSITLS